LEEGWILYVEGYYQRYVDISTGDSRDEKQDENYFEEAYTFVQDYVVVGPVHTDDMLAFHSPMDYIEGGTYSFHNSAAYIAEA